MRIFLLGLAMCLGCTASLTTKYSQEYEIVSKQIDALDKERKQVVSLRFAAKNYLQAKNEYTIKKRRLNLLKQNHHKRGLPTGSTLGENLTLEQEISLLEKHENVISDEIRKLQKRRSKIIDKQMRK